MCRLGSLWFATRLNLAARKPGQPRLPWALAVMLGATLAAGCSAFPEDRNDNGPRTVTEFMKQERPGNGVLGP